MLQKKNLTKIAAIVAKFATSPKGTKQLLVGLVSRASDAVLREAESQCEEFEEALNRATKRYGSSWEDVVILFEWRNELKRIIDSDKLSDLLKQFVNQALSQEPNFYGGFNEATVTAWTSRIEQGDGVDDFVEYLRE